MAGRSGGGRAFGAKVVARVHFLARNLNARVYPTMPPKKNQTDARQKRRVIYDALEIPSVLKRIIVEYTISAGELIEEYACYCVRNLGHIVIYDTLDVRFIMWWSNKRNYYMAHLSVFHRNFFQFEERFDDPRTNDDYIGRVRKQLKKSRAFDLAFCFDNIIDALQQVMVKMMNANAMCA